MQSPPLPYRKEMSISTPRHWYCNPQAFSVCLDCLLILCSGHHVICLHVHVYCLWCVWGILNWTKLCAYCAGSYLIWLTDRWLATGVGVAIWHDCIMTLCMCSVFLWSSAQNEWHVWASSYCTCMLSFLSIACICDDICWKLEPVFHIILLCFSDGYRDN